jgi:CDP-diacylglycerol--serine O-phosphatidyltransferase
MRKGIYILPNAITLCSTFFGFYSIVATFKGNFTAAAWSIVLAAVFDGLDGWVARMTNTASQFGIQMDSLSDVIAFGVAPAVMLYIWALTPFGRVGWAVAFLFTACGALRLARFNVQRDTEERKSFTGMPIPAAAGVASAMVVFYDAVDLVPEKSWFVLGLTVVISLLMVSPLRFHSLKEINMRERKPFWFLVIIVVIVAIIIMHPPVALFVFALIYINVGIIENTYLYLKTGKAGN